MRERYPPVWVRRMCYNLINILYYIAGYSWGYNPYIEGALDMEKTITKDLEE
jgi:hypothetical protein